nr:hypothetical protein [Neorhizobium tomejilense]
MTFFTIVPSFGAFILRAFAIFFGGIVIGILAAMAGAPPLVMPAIMVVTLAACLWTLVSWLRGRA